MRQLVISCKRQFHIALIITLIITLTVVCGCRKRESPAQPQPQQKVAEDAAIQQPAREVRMGDFVTAFSGPAMAPARRDPNIDYALNPNIEQFFVHVPEDYTGETPYGLIVFIDADSDSRQLPAGWQRLLDRRKFLYVAPQRAGNDQYTQRRLGLAVLGALEMMRYYRIDPNRVYVAGFSGGARMAGLLGFFQGDLFRGTIQNCGADFYKPVPNVAATSATDTAGNPYGIFQASDEEVASARHVRFALVTGSEDFRHGNILDLYTVCPELRIISDELWNRVQQRIQFTLQTYGRNFRGMCNRNAASQYLLSGFLKCGECGANLVVVKGRASKYASYGCPQHYSRGACKNSLRIGLEKIETEVLEHLQNEVLRPDVVGLAIQETKLEIEKLTKDTREMSNQRESRKRELEAELRNLATAVAKGAGNTSFLLEAIAERETELREIKRAFTVDQPKPVQLILEGLEDHVMGAISNIRELARSDVTRAKVELGKHVDQIVLTPQPDHSGYLIEGQWTLVGTDNFQAILKECGVGMVPGGGTGTPDGLKNPASLVKPRL